MLVTHLGDTVIEIGAGLGNMTGRLMGKKLRYVAAEGDPLYLHALRNRFLRTPSVTVCQLDPENPADYATWQGQFESAMCVNVLESVTHPQAVLESLAKCLKPGGVLVTLVPQGAGLYGSLDQAMGHKRRFTAAELEQMLRAVGLQVEREYQINKIGTLGWWFSSRVLGRKRISRPALKLWENSVGAAKDRQTAALEGTEQWWWPATLE
jgi:SAM-dependent methyltransferase